MALQKRAFATPLFGRGYSVLQQLLAAGIANPVRGPRRRQDPLDGDVDDTPVFKGRNDALFNHFGCGTTRVRGRQRDDNAAIALHIAHDAEVHDAHDGDLGIGHFGQPLENLVAIEGFSYHVAPG